MAVDLESGGQTGLTPSHFSGRSHVPLEDLQVTEDPSILQVEEQQSLFKRFPV